MITRRLCAYVCVHMFAFACGCARARVLVGGGKHHLSDVFALLPTVAVELATTRRFPAVVVAAVGLTVR